MSENEKLFDVVAVRIKRPGVVRVMDTEMDEENADAYMKMAVMRRGVEVEFFAVVPTGKYKNDDIYRGDKIED